MGGAGGLPTAASSTFNNLCPQGNLYHMLDQPICDEKIKGSFSDYILN